MTDDKREALVNDLLLPGLYNAWGESTGVPEKAAAQLRADGERIKALEAAGRALLAADERGQGQPWADAMRRLRRLVAHP